MEADDDHHPSNTSDVDIQNSDDSISPMQETKLPTQVQAAPSASTRLSRNHHAAAILLPTQKYVLGLVVAYSALFVVAWSIICWTSQRPIGRGSYYCYDTDCHYNERERDEQNARTLRYVADAQTVLSAVSLLTIPLTSAVCAAAAVPWLQSNGQGMSLRQVMALADKGWTSPYIYARLLRPSGWKRYGSSFIALALLLNALGAALSPAISRLSAPISIKVPSVTSTISQLKGIDDLLKSGYGDKVVPLRDALRTGSATEFQPRIWQHQELNCSDDDFSSSLEDWITTPDECRFGGITYQTLASVRNPWVSQLPSGFSVGVREAQYLPRVNSSANAERIDSMPDVCQDGTAALVINHEGESHEDDGEGGSVLRHYWWIKACVPEYTALSPFQRTGDRQMIRETLYLDMFSYDLMTTRYHGIFMITVNTTLGYFELPNYSNGELPGPLLSHYTIPTDNYTKRDVPSYNSEMNSSHEIEWLQEMDNKGPLLNTVFALFGNGSMPAIYAQENATYNSGYEGDFPFGGRGYTCLDVVPLARLFQVIALANPEGYIINWRPACLTSNDIKLGSQMHTFIENFFLPGVDMIGRVFRIAAYMSHSIWLLGEDSNSRTGSIEIERDKGADLQKPGLTTGSIAGLSVVIAGFLLALVTLGFYASVKRSWTWSLDSYAMLRIGAELGEDSIPFLAVNDVDQIAELDDLPGWVGDVGRHDESVGELGIGHFKEVRRINHKRKFKAYEQVRRGRWWIDFKIHRAFAICGLRRSRAPAKVKWLVHKVIDSFETYDPLEEKNRRSSRSQVGEDTSAGMLEATSLPHGQASSDNA